MKKATIIVQAKDADNTVSKLRSLGIIHVQHQKQPQGEDITSLREDLNLVDSAIEILSRPEFLAQNKKQEEQGLKDWKFTPLETTLQSEDKKKFLTGFTSHHIVDLSKRLAQLQEYSFSLKAKIVEWQGWGDFNPQAIEELRNKNIYVGLYQIPAREIKNLPKGLIVKEIFAVRGLKHCVIISRKKIEIPFKEITLPKMSIEEMQTRLSQDARTIELIKDDMHRHLIHLPGFKIAKAQLLKKIEFCEAIKGMGAIENIVYLSGYLPSDKKALLETTAKEENWGFIIDEPCDEDIVPTLIRNPRWVSIISPVFKLLEVIPGYHELDISPFFLCFLSLFFGMIIGDAGYGALYFILTFLVQRKFSHKLKDKKIFFLFYLFSSCAILWGLITGTVFGQEWFIKAGFRPIIPILNDTKFLQAFCFFIGASHLTLAHCLQIIRKSPSLTALTDAGWVCLLWSGFFIAKTLILNDPYPYFVNSLIICGITLVIIFTSPQKNIFKMIGQGLGAVALSLMNNFTDVVSYVRIFAVGLAGVAISDTINTLAAGLGGNFLVQVLILLIGHTINIVLGPLSVLVHGIRLNVLEFSGHANLSWSGVAYKPFK